MAINTLFHSLTSVLRKQYGSTGKVVPFAVGRIYQTIYRNFKHDPKPLLFIIGSDAFYTVGINIHYIGGNGSALMNLIVALRNSKTVLTGYILYQLLKTRTPMVPKLGYRKYFTAMLRGKLVSEGVSTLPEPNIVQFIAEPWVRRLNNLIRPKVFSKTVVDQSTVQGIRDQVIQTQYYKDKSRPFADRKQTTTVQYRPPEESV